MENIGNHTDLGGPAGDRLGQPVVRLHGLAFSYGDEGFSLDVPILEIGHGSKVAVVGPSGCGKTTLIHLVAGILKPVNGSVTVGEVVLGDYPERDLLDYRIATMGLIFQEFRLLEYLNVLENILLPYRLNPVLELSPQTRARAAELATEVGLHDKLERHPKNLSQGERQRAALCRALITRPTLLLADEPTANLDPANRDKILGLLFKYCGEEQATLIMVTHDPEVLQKFDRQVDIREFLPEPKPTAL
ncbi:MAG: ABC transporter ATP-binding protein [Flavobacteriaceae bacterium]|nr:MAG: ABC transporter ATP-binding protein [Flavobacteriaceae bacterium]